MKEARLRRAREDQAIKDKLRRDEEKRRIQARADYVNWEKEYDTVFRDKSSMTKFPFPPLPRYTDTDCPRFLKIPVAAYQHNVKQFFKGSGNDSLFSSVSDSFGTRTIALRPEFIRLANSLPVVLDP
ncbi:hypothetical protein ACEPPN_010883 [Leptodophora sp. 'Broadleaf-Isolate-01']